MLNNLIPFISVIWRPTVEIAILWFVIYQIVLFFEHTRAIQVLRGITVLLAAFFIFRKLNLDVLDWLLNKLFAISVIAILIIFHPEIRQGLARLGQRQLFSTNLRPEELEYVLKNISKAVEHLFNNKIGALIALEKNDFELPTGYYPPSYNLGISG